MNTTRKHPRTMQEAFGPYANSHIYDQDDKRYPALWWVAIWTIFVVTIAVVFLTK